MSKRRHPYEGQRGIRAGHWTREMHEEAAIRSLANANRLIGRRVIHVSHHPGPGQCSPSTARAAFDATHAIANAQAHLSSIGPKEGKRTMRLWAAVSKANTRLKVLSAYVEKCVGQNDLSGTRGKARR